MGKSRRSKVDHHSKKDIQNILELTHKAWLSWRERPIAERAALVGKVGEVMLARKTELAEMCTREMGKVLRESVAEVEKCALACKYYSENAEKFLASEAIKTEGQESFVVYNPLGVVLAVMPWNFPYWQVIRFAAPALCAGNGAVLKHSSNTFGCAKLLESVFKEAGLPENIFRALIIGSEEVAAVIEHKLVKAVTLTGSTAAGRKVAAKAGECLKKTVLELGGSDPYIILEDADIAAAAKVLVQGRMLNAGQSCISPKRFIAVKSVYGEFRDKVLSEMKNVTFGDPMNADSGIGPMSREDLRDELHEQVMKSVSQGARLLLGGKIPDIKGAYYPPTVLADVRPGMVAFDQELFGPVVCIIEADDEAHAITLANQSEYGLGAGVFTKDIARAKRIALSGIESGGVFVNDFLKSDPRLPFGGIKDSGYGRELSRLGIHEFVNAKTIFIK